MAKINYKEIDKEMRPVIKELNKLGLKTRHCCIGHDKTTAYITFDMREDVSVHIKNNVLSINWHTGIGEK